METVIASHSCKYSCAGPLAQRTALRAFYYDRILIAEVLMQTNVTGDHYVAGWDKRGTAGAPFII
jgi:hypothetical protein